MACFSVRTGHQVRAALVINTTGIVIAKTWIAVGYDRRLWLLLLARSPARLLLLPISIRYGLRIGVLIGGKDEHRRGSTHERRTHGCREGRARYIFAAPGKRLGHGCHICIDRGQGIYANCPADLIAVNDGAGLDAGRVPWRYGNSCGILHQLRLASAGRIRLGDSCVDRAAPLVIVAVDGA